MITIFLYNKEDIIGLGVNEEDLNNLSYIGIPNALNDADSNNGNNGYPIQKSAFDNKIILLNILGKDVHTYDKNDCYVYKIADDVFAIIEPSGGGK